MAGLAAAERERVEVYIAKEFAFERVLEEEAAAHAEPAMARL